MVLWLAGAGGARAGRRLTTTSPLGLLRTEGSSTVSPKNHLSPMSQNPFLLSPSSFLSMTSTVVTLNCTPALSTPPQATNPHVPQPRGRHPRLPLPAPNLPGSVASATVPLCPRPTPHRSCVRACVRAMHTCILATEFHRFAQARSVSKDAGAVDGAAWGGGGGSRLRGHTHERGELARPRRRKGELGEE